MIELSDFKRKIDKYLLDFLNQKIESLPPHKNEEIEEIFTHLKTFAKEGKRIRSYIAFLGYKLSGGKEEEKAIKLFISIELFHAFCLIHDDIMDKAASRHGIKTIHKFVSDSVKNDKFVNPQHFGDSQAILIGDSLLAWTLEVLFKNKDFSIERIDRAREIFFKMGDEVLVGQMIDVDMARREKVTNEQIIQKMFLKTATYSFIRPLMIGAYLAKDVKSEEKIFKDLGKYLGLAFQIQDDLLDIKYDQSKTQKTSFNDVSQHQHTLLSNFIFENGTPEQKNILKQLFGSQLSQADKEKLRMVFHDSGAIKYAEKEIINNINLAKDLLNKRVINGESKTLFLKLINDLSQRSR